MIYIQSLSTSGFNAKFRLLGDKNPPCSRKKSRITTTRLHCSNQAPKCDVWVLFQLKTDHSNRRNYIQRWFAGRKWEADGDLAFATPDGQKQRLLSRIFPAGRLLFANRSVRRVVRTKPPSQLRRPAARPPDPGSIPEPALVFLWFSVHFRSVPSLVTSVCCLYPSLTAALVLLDAPHRRLLLSYPSGRALKSTANGQIANSGMLTYNPLASLFHVQTRMQSSFGFGHLPVG